MLKDKLVVNQRINVKIFKNIIVLNLLIVLTLGSVGVLSYTSYLSYQEHSKPQRSVKLSVFLEEIVYVLRKIDDERLKSATYLVTHSKSKFVQVIEARDIVDQSLLKLSRYLKENSTLSLYSTDVKDIYGALRHVRKEVDSLSRDYRKILFNGYHAEVFTPFFHMLSELALNQNSEILKSYFLMYEKIIVLKENTVLENTVIYSILLQKTPMSKQDKEIWDQVIAKDRLPQFSRLSDSAVSADLHALLFPDEYIRILSKERKQILEGATSGKYAVTVIAWLDKIIKKTDYFRQIESILYSHIQKLDAKNVSPSNTLLFFYAAVIFVLFLLLFKLLEVRSARIKNKQIYEDTRRDIALVFDKDQQKKFKRLIENGQLDLIYKFLIKAIEDSNQTKDLFLASMSHEIRTPLNGILGFTQLLKETGMTEEQYEFLLVVEKSSEHLLSIVNDILDLSKIKAHKIELESIDFDPIESFEAALESYAVKALEKNIEFNTFLDPQLPTLLTGDPTKISQVIVNLLSNAIKFTSNNGEVSVSIEKLSESADETKVKFSVSDTGIGITKEQQKNIFEAFSQADISTSRKYGGTGLGLSISGKLINLMGGELKIKSVKDEGSTFYFIIVIKKPKAASRRVVDNMSAYTVGILNPHIDTEYYINRDLEAYITYTGAAIMYYTDKTLLAIKDKSKLPDILFIDHKFRQRGGEIEKFINIDTKIVVMSTGDQKRNLKRYGSRIDKILYKPINFTKTLKALNSKEESTESKKQINFENIHVLVAEDNLINQKLIINVLNRIGVEVSIANNGQEALDYRMNEKCDMIFMDIEMPIMGGMEATGNILSYERNNAKKHVPIIALTANALAGDKEKYIATGMDGYLSKPIELDNLRDIFKEYFEERIVELEA